MSIKEMTKNEATGYEKLSLLTKISYGLGDLASQLVWTFVGSYLTIFYTDIVGLTPAIISMIMLVARVWDGINDPMLGAIAERTRSKFGRFRPYIFYGTPFLAVFSVLTFTSPGFGGNETAKVIWAMVTYIGLGMLYTVVNLPYGSLATVMSKSSAERTALNSYRMIGTNLGGVLLNMISMPLLVFFSGGKENVLTTKGYVLTTIVFAVIAVPLFYMVFANSKEVVQPIAPDKKVSIKDTAKVILTDRPLMCIFFMMLFAMTGFFGRMGVVIYYYIYVLQRFDLITLFMTLPSLFAAISIFLFARFAKKIGKKNMLFLSFGLSAVSLLFIYTVDYTNIPMLIFGTAFYGLTNFGAPIIMSMVPDAIDNVENNTGIRADGTAYATISLATKFASALAGAVGVILLSSFGYVANAQQTEAAMKGINIVVNLLPAGCYILSLIPLALYNISEKRYEEIRKSLDAKAEEYKRENN